MGLRFFCILILGIFACSKVNQWKQPTKINFNVALVDLSSLDGKLNFEKGYCSLKSLNFDGNRTEGADVYFTKEYDSFLDVTFGNSTNEALEFDIPQGAYNSIMITLVSNSNDRPNLVLEGKYEDITGKKHPIRFELEENETFIIEGKSLDNSNNSINLLSDAPTNATITLSSSQLFSKVTESLLASAESVNFNGVNTILINSTINKPIYDLVVGSLDSESLHAVIVQ